jgi:choline kinase
MKVIILAAGRGRRMGDKTTDIPKCLTVLHGFTLLDRCIAALDTVGIARGDIGIVTGYRASSVIVDGVKYFHNPKWETTNMFISLTKAREWLVAEPCIVLYSDIVFNPGVIQRLAACSSELALPYYTRFMELWEKRLDNPLDDLETFRFDGEELLEIGLKPRDINEVQGQYMGIIRFEPTAWRKVEEAIKLPMPKPVEKLDMTTLLQHMLSLGQRIDVFPTDELWLECDTASDVELYERLWGHDTLMPV